MIERLERYPWPGNVRELANMLESGILLADSGQLDDTELGGEALSTPTAEPGFKACRKQILDRQERKYMAGALRRFQGDIARSAVAMELTPRAVYLKLREPGLDPAIYRLARGRRNR